MSNKRRKPVRLLTDLKIDEISSCDHGAGEGCEVMLVKRNHGYPPELCRAFAKSTDVPLDPDAINPGGTEPDDDDDANYTEHLSDDADESDESDTGGESTDQLERARRAMKREDQTMKSHSELMRDVIKRYGLIPFCKSVANGDVRVSEHELTKVICESADRANTTFAKLFEANTEEGITLRKAITAARDAQFLSKLGPRPSPSMGGGSTPHFHAGDGSGAGEGGAARARFSSATLRPRVTGGRAATAVDNPKTALAQLQELVDAQRAEHPTLSEAQVFGMVYEDRANAELVRREREENRPRAW
jgi:hypothetical protein